MLLTLYSRVGCHLCDEFQAAVQVVQARLSFELEVLDIDLNPELEQRYGWLVPVLAWNGQEILRHHWDYERLANFLRTMTAPELSTPGALASAGKSA